MRLEDFVQQSRQAEEMAAAEVRRNLHDYPDAVIVGDEICIVTESDVDAIINEAIAAMPAWMQKGFKSVESK